MRKQTRQRRLFFEQLEDRMSMTVNASTGDYAQRAALTVADLDGDRSAEFIYSDQALNQISIAHAPSKQRVLVDGHGQLSAPGSVVVADLNGDGLADLIVPNSAANEVLVFLANANGQGGAEPFLSPLAFASGLHPESVSVGDLNGDATLDLIVANRDSNDVSVFMGLGSGTNWTLIAGRGLRAGLGPVASEIVDVTGPSGGPDGILDVVVANNVSNTVLAMRGLGNGDFDDLSPVVFVTGDGPHAIVVGDFGLGVVNTRSGTISLFYGYNPADRHDLATGGLGPIAAVVANVDRDGQDEIIVAHSGNGLVSFLDVLPTPLLRQAAVYNDFLHFTSLEKFGIGAAQKVYGLANGNSEVLVVFDAGRMGGPGGQPEPGPSSPPPTAGGAEKIDPSGLDAIRCSVSLTGLTSQANLIVDFTSLRGSSLPTVATLLLSSGNGMQQDDGFGRPRPKRAKRFEMLHDDNAADQVQSAAIDIPRMDPISKLLIDLDEQILEVVQGDLPSSTGIRSGIAPVVSARRAIEKTSGELPSTPEHPAHSTQSSAVGREMAFLEDENLQAP